MYTGRSTSDEDPVAFFVLKKSILEICRFATLEVSVYYERTSGRPEPLAH